MEISRVGIVGAGTMGRSISQLLATNGFSVTLVDLSYSIAENGKNAIALNLRRLEEKGKISHAKSVEVMSRITGMSLADLQGEDLILECIVENIRAKRQLLKNLDSIADKKTIFASNTSSYRISEIAQGLSQGRAVFGMHFFNPVWTLPLVELVVPRNISLVQKDAVQEFLARNGRQVVEVVDSPGFVVNRVLFGMVAESCILMDNGVASVGDIDKAMKTGANLPMGPFELVDLIGLDTSSEILRSLGDRLSNDAYIRAAGIMSSMIEKGYLGRKSGRGFYEYNQKHQ